MTKLYIRQLGVGWQSIEKDGSRLSSCSRSNILANYLNPNNSVSVAVVDFTRRVLASAFCAIGSGSEFQASRLHEVLSMLVRS